MPLPRSVARLNRAVTNHATRPLAGHLPGLGVVVHIGRRSGQTYRTPVNVFRRPGGYAIALTYGSSAQWTRNVLAAGHADIVTRGRTHRVTNPRVVHDAERTPVPAPVRAILGALRVDDFLLVDEVDEIDRGEAE
jgi:deazaflavin-dependent oxidoreductase (nitroreductase family)